jgi:hypothetical protein
LKEKITWIHSNSPSLAVPSAFIFVMVFVADAYAAHAGFCFYVDKSSAVKQNRQELRRRFRIQKLTPKINAQSYIYIMQVICSIPLAIYFGRIKNVKKAPMIKYIPMIICPIKPKG